MFNKFLTGQADGGNKASFSSKFRKERLAIFFDFIEDLPAPVKILDVGGTESFWEMAELAGNEKYQITILNIREEETKYPNLKSVRGDAKNMKEFPDQSFDVVFSNSVIEHVGGLAEQEKMAEEIRRIGKKYFVQTPNFYFPVEPHFLFPFFQFFPLSIESLLIRNFNLGWRKKILDKEQAKNEAQSVRLLKKKELEKLFPGAKIKKEKLFFLTKSFMVMKS